MNRRIAEESGRQDSRGSTPGLAAPSMRTASKAILITGENVEEMKRRFDSLSEDDPEYDVLGDALHRYMIG